MQIAIAAIEAIRDVEPRARAVSAEPANYVIPRSDDWHDIHAARHDTLAQFDALDLLSGRMRPELGGRPDYVDVIGVNYYRHNQWIDGDLPVALNHPQYRPLRDLLVDVHRRYGRPRFIAENRDRGGSPPGLAARHRLRGGGRQAGGRARPPQVEDAFTL